jgi:hypothetical protein
MAVDPRLSLEEKKRFEQRRSLIRAGNFAAIPAGYRVARDQGAVGLARAVGEGLTEQGVAIGDFVGPKVDAIVYGSGGPEATRQENARAAAAEHPQFNNIERDASSTSAYALGDTAKTGLNRIFKSKDANGNSVYSNIAPAAGSHAEERYYDQYGSRLGENSQGQYDARLDPLNNVTARNAAIERGQASIDYAQRGQLARAEVDRQAMLDALPPEERAQLIERQAQEQGLDSRAAADRGLRRELAGASNAIATRNADINAANLAFNQDQALSKVERENPAAAVMQQIDSLKNLGRDQKLRVLSNPNDPRTARVLGLIERAAHTAGAGGDTSLAQFRKTGGLRRALTHNTFSDGSGAFGIGNGFNPNDFGMTEEDFQTVIDGYLNAQANANR